MHRTVEENKHFLRNIYAKGPFEGHAFCCSPETVTPYQSEGGEFTLSEKPVSHWVGWVAENYRRAVEMQEQIGDHNVPLAWLNTGTHIYAAAFGCKVHAPEDDMPFALPFVNSPAEAAKVAEPDLWKSPTLYRIFELAELVQKELGPDACMTVPDMQSGFDTAALIWNKEDLLCSLLLEPAAVKDLAGKCARLFKRFVAEFRKAFPATSPCHCPNVWAPPEMGPWLSNDECGVMNVETFEEFCLPELIDLAETFGSLGMHCCANAEHQFPSFRKIPNFYAFNRVAGQKGYSTILDTFNDADSPVHVLAWMEEDDIRWLLEHARPGVRFIFNHIGAPVDEAKQWFEEMQQFSSEVAKG